MRQFILALMLMTSPLLAQDADTAVLPPDGGLDSLYGAVEVPDAADPAMIITALQNPKGQKTATDLAMTRLKPPDAMRAIMAEHLTALLAEPAVLKGFSQELADTFAGMGVTPSNPDVIARMAGEMLPTWGEESVTYGVARLSAVQQAQAMALRIRLATAASADDCAMYLSGAQEPFQTRAMQMQIMAAWPTADVGAAMALSRAAMVAELSDTAGAPELTFAQISAVEQAAGMAIIAAVDATDDPPRLYAAFGYPEQATSEDICKARLTMLQAVQGMTGPDAGLALRYVTAFGLNG